MVLVMKYALELLPTNVYYKEQTAINMQNRAFSEVLDGSHCNCNRNINNGIT